MSITYRVNGREVSREEFLAGTVFPQRCPGIAGDRTDWSKDIDQKRKVNGARYAPQLARFPNDPKAFFRSKKELLEAARRRGMDEVKD